MSISRASLVLAINTIKSSQYKGADAAFVTAALEEFTETVKLIDSAAEQSKKAGVASGSGVQDAPADQGKKSGKKS